MKTTINKWRTSIVSLVIAIGLIALATGCSKTGNNTSFTGTYIGTLGMNLYTEPDTIAITAGSTSTAIVMASKTGTGSNYTINATTSGSTLNIPSQSVFVPSLNTTYTVTGSGTLNGSTIKITYVFVSSSNTTYNWSFSGTK